MTPGADPHPLFASRAQRASFRGARLARRPRRVGTAQSRAGRLPFPPPPVARCRARIRRVLRALRALFLPAGHPARAFRDARRDQPHRDRPDRAQPRRHHRSQRHRAGAKLFGVHARDHAVADPEPGRDDRSVGEHRRNPAARSQAVPQAPRGIEGFRELAAAHPPHRRRGRALRRQPLSLPRSRHQGAALSPVSVRRNRLACRGLHRPHQRQGQRADRRLGRDRELQGLGLHRQGRHRAFVRARVARHDGRRGRRGRCRRACRANAATHAARQRQQPDAIARYQAAAGGGGRVRGSPRRARRHRSDVGRRAGVRIEARIRSEPVRRRHRFGELAGAERFAGQAAVEPAAARRVPAGLDDQAVPGARGADVGTPHGDANDLRPRILPDSRPGAPFSRRQARRTRYGRHVQVDRSVLRHVLLHARQRHRHRRYRALPRAGSASARKPASTSKAS